MARCAKHPGRAAIIPHGDLAREFLAPPRSWRQKNPGQEKCLRLELQIRIELFVDPLEIVLLRAGPIEPQVDVKDRNPRLKEVREVREPGRLRGSQDLAGQFAVDVKRRHPVQDLDLTGQPCAPKGTWKQCQPHRDSEGCNDCLLHGLYPLLDSLNP